MTSNHSRSAWSVNKGVAPGFLLVSFLLGNLAQSFAMRFFSPQKGHFRGYLDPGRFLTIDVKLNICSSFGGYHIGLHKWTLNPGNLEKPVWMVKALVGSEKSKRIQVLFFLTISRNLPREIQKVQTPNWLRANPRRLILPSRFTPSMELYQFWGV